MLWFGPYTRILNVEDIKRFPAFVPLIPPFLQNSLFPRSHELVGFLEFDKELFSLRIIKEYGHSYNYIEYTYACKGIENTKVSQALKAICYVPHTYAPPY